MFLLMAELISLLHEYTHGIKMKLIQRLKHCSQFFQCGGPKQIDMFEGIAVDDT